MLKLFCLLYPLYNSIQLYKVLKMIVLYYYLDTKWEKTPLTFKKNIATNELYTIIYNYCTAKCVVIASRAEISVARYANKAKFSSGQILVDGIYRGEII